MKHVLIAWLAALALCSGAHAGPLTLFNVQAEATAVALTSDGAAGFASQSGPLGTGRFTQSADSVGLGDVATAGAVVGLGLLSTSAGASASGFGSAVSTARLVGSFVNAGVVSLDIDFGTSSFSDGSGGASTTLFVRLVSDGITLFSDYVTDAWHIDHTPLFGSTSVLDLTLSSEASAAFLSAGAGNASSFGLATITSSVPESPTWLLCALGLALLSASRSKRQRASS